MDQHIAVYLDFDNIVMSRYDELHGRLAYRNDNPSAREITSLVSSRLEEARIDISAIIEYASSFGTVAVSRAYADWSTRVNAGYGHDLLRNSIDLIQMFPITGSKNGADIRLAIDVMDDVSKYAHISHVMIVSGDSDYMSLAQRCRRLGRRVIGVGAARSVGRYFRSACDEYSYYGTLPSVVLSRAAIQSVIESPPEATVPPNAVRDPLRRAMLLLSAKSVDEWVRPTQLKDQLKRLDAEFNEKALGYTGFTAFLRSFPDLVEVVQDGSGGTVRLISTAADPSTAVEFVDTDIESSDFTVRKALGLPRVIPVGTAWEETCLQVARATWQAVAVPGYKEISWPTKPVLAILRDQGVNDLVARRCTSLAFLTLPLLVRQVDFVLYPNPELVGLNDQEVLSLLRQGVASRVQHRMYPETVGAQQVCQAVYGPDVPAGAVDDVARALTLAPVQSMNQALEQVLMPAPILWDMCGAIGTLTPDDDIRTANDLAQALRPALDELERDLDTVPMQACLEAFRAAGILTGDDTRVNLAIPADTEVPDVARRVVLDWARRLRHSNQLIPDEPMSRESFYRIVLQDRLQAMWREWAREVAEEAK